MKKSVSLREIILLVLLLTIILYYYLIQMPVQNSMDAISKQRADIQSEIDTKTGLLVSQKSMEKQLDEIYKQYNGNPPRLPEYDNSDAVIVQLNTILASADSFSINFKDQITEDAPLVMRRAVMLSYTTKTYAAAKSILKNLDSCTFENQISDLNITDNTVKNSTEDANVEVSLVMTFFEYTGTANTADAGAAATPDAGTTGTQT